MFDLNTTILLEESLFSQSLFGSHTNCFMVSQSSVTTFHGFPILSDYYFTFLLDLTEGQGEQVCVFATVRLFS